MSFPSFCFLSVKFRFPWRYVFSHFSLAFLFSTFSNLWVGTGDGFLTIYKGSFYLSLFISYLRFYQIHSSWETISAKNEE